MKVNHKTSIRSLLIIDLLVIFWIYNSHCKKSSNSTYDSSVTPTISSVYPLTGSYATLDTIKGSGFNPNALYDTVKFNGANAIIKSATGTQLIVLVPKAAGTGFITIKIGNKTSKGPLFSFIYTITVSTLAGVATSGYLDEIDSLAKFDFPVGLALDNFGNLFVGDGSNYCIRKIGTNGMVSTFAGSRMAGYEDAMGGMAKFAGSEGLAIDKKGNLYVADTYNNRIRLVNTQGVVSTIAGNAIQNLINGKGTAAEFSHPSSLALDLKGNIYVADQLNNSIRKIDTTGMVTTIAGNINGGFMNGVESKATFNSPSGIAVDSLGNIYIADEANNMIRRINNQGEVSTLAGSTIAGNADGSDTSARFNGPTGITLDNRGNLYVSDSKNNSIRMVSTHGMVTTIAGGISGIFTNGTGVKATFFNPQGITIDSNGNLYVADENNQRIRKIVVE